jgi:hypothetical protein
MQRIINFNLAIKSRGLPMRKKWLLVGVLILVLVAVVYYAYQNYMEVQRYEELRAWEEAAMARGEIIPAPAPPEVIYTMLGIVAVMIVAVLGIIIRMR